MLYSLYPKSSIPLLSTWPVSVYHASNTPRLLLHVSSTVELYRISQRRTTRILLSVSFAPRFLSSVFVYYLPQYCPGLTGRDRHTVTLSITHVQYIPFFRSKGTPHLIRTKKPEQYRHVNRWSTRPLHSHRPILTHHPCTDCAYTLRAAALIKRHFTFIHISTHTLWVRYL